MEEAETYPTRYEISLPMEVFMDRWAWMLQNLGNQRIKVDEQILRQLEEQRQVEQIAAEIRDLRKSQGVSQTELARRIGSTQPSLARFEAGKVPGVSYGFVRRLLEALGAS